MTPPDEEWMDWLRSQVALFSSSMLDHYRDESPIYPAIGADRVMVTRVALTDLTAMIQSLLADPGQWRAPRPLQPGGDLEQWR